MRQRSLVQVAVALLLFVVLALAQTEQGRGRRFGQGGPNPGNPPDPQQMLQNRIDRLASLLSLTDDQKSQAATIFGNAAQAVQPLHQQSRDARNSLQDAVKANNITQIEQLSNTIGTLTGQTTAIESKAEAQFISILTAEQKAKLPNGAFGFSGGPGFGGRRGPAPPNP